MIEKNLRKWLRPVVIRRKRLMLRKTLSLYWFIAAIAGIMIIIADRLWMWSSPVEIWALIAGIIVATIIAFVKSGADEPDYKAIARNIEQQNPELRATLLTAIEQEPEKPFGQLGYLQERVIGEALAHAKENDWVQSISQKTFFTAALGQIAAMTFFVVVLLQLLSNTSLAPTKGRAVPARNNYNITVTPGDTTIETGSTIVIEARFDERVPDEVKLLIGPSPEEMQELPLKKNLEDPIFGRVIPQVNSDMIYHIEYANRNTQDYKITTYEHPLLERADAKIIYPSYTNLPEKIVKDTRRIGVVESSEVTLTFTLNKSVDTAKLVAKDGSEIELAEDAEHEHLFASPVIIPTESLRYELKLVDTEGRANKVPPRFVIDVHKNLPADLKLTFPSRDIEASPLEELTLQAEVTDDYGVASYGTSYILAGIEPQDITLGESVPANKKQPVEYILALEDLHVQPDQLLTYYFWADDIGPDGNIRRTVSDLYFTEIRPFEQIFRENQSFMDQSQQQERQQEQQQDMQGEQQQREELIQLQKQIISATWNVKRQADLSDSIENQKEDLDLVRQSQADALDMARSSSQEGQGQGFQPTFPQLRVMGQRRGGSPNNSTTSDAMEQAAQHMETALEHLQETLESGTTDELIQALAAEQAAYQELLKTREHENEVARDRSGQRGNMNQSARSQQQLQQLEMRQREDRYETQRQAQEEQTQQQEDLQVLNRLRELARRENEMTDRLREAEASLREAQTEEERNEIRRQLERLQEEQVETLRDIDELQQRMENEQNRQRMSDMSEQLGETRSRIQQSAEELEQGDVSDAAASTTRAQRELEEMRDEFQRRTSGQFSEQMRNMREQAQQLDESQREISQEMRQQTDSDEQMSLEAGTNQDLADRVQQQRETMEDLLEQMREVSEQSENSEPLLSRRLYDTYRQTSTENVDRSLEATEELLRRNFLPQAQEIEEQAREGIQNLREGIEEAARGVLGDEADSLRLAREQLDELINQINEETQANRTGQTGDPNQMGNQQARESTNGQTGDPNQMENQQAREGTNGQIGDPNQMENQQAREGMRGQPGDQNQMENQQAREGMRGQGGDPNQRGNQQAREGMRGQQNPSTGERRNLSDPGGWSGFQELTGPEYDPNRPLTGDDFRQWADRLRDVEEMLSEQELREEVATVRDQARTIREEYTRHGTEPQWDVVEMQITKPLNEVRNRVNEELAKLESREALVPIDRDPVPSRYAELVRIYYENLGGGD